MLERKYRLTAEKDFARIFSKGRPFHGRGVAMKAMRNRVGAPRVGFVVSTKVSKRAVIRNRIKRRMREIVRKRLPGFADAVDIVFMARNESTAMSFAELERTINDLLGNAGLIRRT